MHSLEVGTHGPVSDCLKSGDGGLLTEKTFFSNNSSLKQRNNKKNYMKKNVQNLGKYVNAHWQSFQTQKPIWWIALRTGKRKAYNNSNKSKLKYLLSLTPCDDKETNFMNSFRNRKGKHPTTIGQYPEGSLTSYTQKTSTYWHKVNV